MSTEEKTWGCTVVAREHCPRSVFPLRLSRVDGK